MLPLCVALAWVACARMAPPTGGPEDREAPRVVAYAPDSGATAVAPAAPLVLHFSEAMDRGSVEDWLLIAPWPGRLACRWQAQQLRCQPREPWRPATTYAVLLGSQATDRRGNGLATPLVFAFATGDSLARGHITGEVRTRSLAARGAPVYLFPWPDTLHAPLPPAANLRPDPLTALRLGQADAEGVFRLPFVPTGEPFLVGALHDRNGNRAFDAREDLWGFAEFPIVVPDTGAATTAIELYLVYADEPGDLAGRAIDSLCLGYAAPARWQARIDSIAGILAGERDPSGFGGAVGDTAALAELTAAEEESLQVLQARFEQRRAQAQRDSGRCTAPIWVSAWSDAAPDSAPAAETRTLADFTLAELAPGLYRLRAFRDLDRDGVRDAGEPAARFPAAIELQPGRRIADLDLPLRPGTDVVPGAGARPDGEAR